MPYPIGVGGRTRTLGYVLIRVQVEGVPGYNEEQVAFVVDDPTTTSHIQVLIVLGTPTINRDIAIMKESDGTDYDDWLPQAECHDPGTLP